MMGTMIALNAVDSINDHLLILAEKRKAWWFQSAVTNWSPMITILRKAGVRE